MYKSLDRDLVNGQKRAARQFLPGCPRPILPQPRLLAAVLTSLLSHVDEGLKHLVTRRDHLAVRFEPALSDDHVSEFLSEIDVRHFERTACDCGRCVLARIAD